MENKELEKLPILLEGDYFFLNPTYSKQIAEFEKQAKAIKEAEDKLKAEILSSMEELGIVKIENDDIAISYVAETYRETFDSKSFKVDNEQLYNQYTKISPVKSSIRIKVK